MLPKSWTSPERLADRGRDRALLRRVRKPLHLDWYKAEDPTTHGKAKSEVRLLIARFGHRSIDTLRRMEMESYKTDRLTKDTVAPETVCQEVRRLQAASRHGVKWNELDFSPLAETQAPRGVRSVAVRFIECGDPGPIRTGDLPLRRGTLYPAELRGHWQP